MSQYSPNLNEGFPQNSVIGHTVGSYRQPRILMGHRSSMIQNSAAAGLMLSSSVFLNST